MKLPIGTKLVATEDWAKNFKKGEEYIVSKHVKVGETGKEYLISDLAHFPKEVIKKHFKLVENKKKDKVDSKDTKVKTPRKRVLFPWMKTYQGRCYKAMLAILADRKGWNKVITGDVNFNKRLGTIIIETNKYFPEMYTIVSKFYSDKGRMLEKKDFIPIAKGRLTMMFKFDRTNKKIVKLHEHPENSAGKFADAIQTCHELIEKNKEYKDPT